MSDLYFIPAYRKVVQFICLAIVLLIVPVSNAQEPIAPAPDVPLGPTEEVRAAEQMAVDVASRKPSDFRIEFFIAPDALASADYLSMGDLLTELDVTPTTDWESFSLKEGYEGTQIVIVDQSALDFVDREWMREAYRSRVIIVGMDLSYEEMVELTGEHCSGVDNRVEFKHHFWIFEYTYSVELGGEMLAEIDDDLEQIIYESATETCIYKSSKDERLVKRPESVFIGQGFYFQPITDETWVNTLLSLLMHISYQYDMPNPQLEIATD